MKQRITSRFTLTGDIRLATWVFLGGIVLKTWLVVLNVGWTKKTAYLRSDYY
jgi:hypothetical protein